MAIIDSGTTATRVNESVRAPLDGVTVQRRRFVPGTLQDIVVLAGLALVALHVINAVLLQSSDPSFRRLVWAVVTLATTATAGYFYNSLARPWKGAIALAFGLPALITGVAIYAVHVSQLGFRQNDYTGIPLIVVGILLSCIGIVILVMAVRPWWRRLLLIPVAVAFAFYVVLPVSLGVFGTNIPRLPVQSGDTPAAHGLAYEDVSFPTEDGVMLTGWYLPSQNGAVVITVHGAFRGKDRTMDHAVVLARNGYGVLMLDLEGFGDSEGRANAYGWVGARGVHAATTYLLARPEIDADKIGGLGLSMGGEVLLQAAGESTALKAVVSEGGSSRTPDDLGEMPGLSTKLFGVPLQWTLATTMRLITGEPVPPALKDMVRQIGPRNVLLISADEEGERTLNRLYHEVGGPSFDHWEIPESKHMGALELHPEEYEQRVVGFFDAAFFPGASP